MALNNLPVDVQQYLILNYESDVKWIILFGFWMLSMIYVHYWYDEQKDTKYFLVGTYRATMYFMSKMWNYLFWLLFPVTLHPAVGIDNLLIFLGYAYTGLIGFAFILFVFNFTLWLPKFILERGKLDISGWEDKAIENYFGKGFKINWFQKK